MLDSFRTVIANASEAQIRADPTLRGALIIERAGDFTMYYGPFEHVQASARVVLVGITPGALQATNALCSARSDLLAGKPDGDVLSRAKRFASFSGPMRGNLVAMLDSVGLQHWLGVGSTEVLWADGSFAAHFTSAVRWPTFHRGTNYSGTPGISAVPMLSRVVGDCLASEARALPDAVWVPLGPAATAALGVLICNGLLEPSRVLNGLPHPSGANGERIKYFLGRKERALLSAKTDPRVLDAAKQDLIAKVAAL